MKPIILLSLIAVLIFGSCSVATSEGYKQRMQQWMGYDISVIISRWGIPSKEYTLPNGNKLYSYLWTGETRVATYYDDYLGLALSNKYTYWCKTTMEADKTGKIINISWEGNNCVAKELE